MMVKISANNIVLRLKKYSLRNYVKKSNLIPL